ncbi:NADP-dependent malate dehydrogenase [Salmonella enterica subsp. enterica]|uniref:NADP-dependent malate dehydrogenase n=1 Tax=Salmonella enterica I TaxID=59201 RepID=A0A447PCC0_SALET|nr:NADP-dependent malate dehydrogenase [Salmonella enterica subsp. enterica]
MIDGEMHGDAALVESIRNDRMPDSPLKGAAQYSGDAEYGSRPH